MATPTIALHPFASLGHADDGLLKAVHHFSFANYRDPARMGWGRLRVWNDDEIAPQSGFSPHPHREMEFITFVRSGTIAHQDNLGNRGCPVAGDVQLMCAGNGIVHAEYNLEDKRTTLFQIWIETDSKGDQPRWGQQEFPRGARAGRWVTVASNLPDADGSLLTVRPLDPAELILVDSR